MTRCAIYIRVSTEEQKMNGLSIETQKNVLTEFAEKHNMHIIDYYIDAGMTARKRLNHRLELQRLLNDISNGLIDVIIFTKLDRWFRNISDYYKVQEILDQCKVNWKTIYENYDTSTANGRLHINIMLSIAQDEADRTSERIKLVFENKRAKGEVTSGHAPLGYKIVNSKLVTDEESKQIAIDIFNHYDINHCINACVRMVREKYNRHVYDYTIRRMFENETYIGKIRGVNAFCESIISEELFYRVQEHRALREYKNTLVQGRVYLFSSLLFCKECGHNLSSSYNIQQQKYQKKEFHYYRCKEATVHFKCIHRRRINEEYLERYLLTNLSKELREHIIELNTKKAAQQKNYIDPNKIKNKLDKLKDLYLDDLIDKDTYKKEYEILTKQLNSIDNYRELDLNKYTNIIDGDFNKVYAELSLEERKAFWLGIINRIIIDHENNIEIFFK